MFIGYNLENLRIMNGYSRKQLSELINVSEQAIWQYENSYTSPKLPTINALSDLFDVRSKYFYTPDILNRQNVQKDNIKIENIAYRAKVINTISKTQAEAKHIDFLDKLINSLIYNIKLSTLNIINLRNNIIKYLSETSDDRHTQLKIVASTARSFLNLAEGSNDELLYRIEKSGVYILEKAIGEKIDAYSLWTNDEKAFIILGNIKKSAVRRNFDLAHELGHLLLHYNIEFNRLTAKEHKDIENEANFFASEFLLPEEQVRKDLQEIPLKTNPESYLDLKRKWKVSLQVLGYRSTQLGVLQAKDHRNFYASMHRKKYLELEPLDDLIPIQKPTKIKTIIKFLDSKKLLNIIDYIENEWLVTSEFFTKLTGIEDEFINQFKINNQDFSISYINDFRKSIK